MKRGSYMNSAAYSPFARAQREEQQARWLLWQMQSVEIESDQPQESAPPREAQMVSVPAPQHRRYDAVVRRMQQARQQTGAYSAWT